MADISLLPTVTVTGKRETPQGFKVRLTGPGGQLTFEASAPVTESRQASYTGFDIVHLPTNIHAYKNTGSRKYTITGKLVSRTKSEANANSKNLDLARKWLLPDFGDSGATPPILKFFAYGNKNINGRKVILISYDWTFPDDTDYIYTGTQPMPVIGLLTIAVEEVYSAEEITAKAWKLQEADGGDFAPGEAGNSSAFVLGANEVTPGALMQRLGRASNGVSDILSTVGSQLARGATPTLAGVIAGQLTRSATSTLLNSPQVQSVIAKVPSFARNVFVAGANATAASLGRIATRRVSEATTPTPPADPFAAAPPLNPPTVLGE
jgi:hypothetical protein